MRTELEPQDIEVIAQRVLEVLRPILFNQEKAGDGRDTIFDVKGLAGYLQVDCGWVYKQISLGTIPFFKAGKYSRFRKKDIDKWIENQMARSIPILKVMKRG